MFLYQGSVSYIFLLTVNNPSICAKINGPSCAISPRFISRENIRDLKQRPRRQRQRRRGKTKGLMSRTIAMHVYYKTLYISQPSSAKKKNVKSLHSPGYILRIQDNASPDGKFFMFLLENEARLYIFSLRYFDAVRQAEYIQPFAKFVREMQVQFLIDVFLDAAVVVA